MSCKTSCIILALTVAALSGCERQLPTGTDSETADSPLAASRPGHRSFERSAMDRLARRMARALREPEFRLHLKSELDRSPFVEHKLELRSLLKASGGRVLRQLAKVSNEVESAVELDVEQAVALELYFPVPEHRVAWSGGPDVLVASALEDREAPVAYDVRGRRHVLSASSPPTTPVLARVPVETDFGAAVAHAVGAPAPSPTPPPPSAPPPGLYATYSRFVEDFEGWFKGSPEFEIHILGQLGTSDSLTGYQCAGAGAGGYYRFDQNSLTWSGQVLLFSQTQLNSYRAAHPNQNFRIIALEDDDTSCTIKFDSNRFKNLQTTLQAAYPDLTGSKDTTTSQLVRLIKRANALQKILRAAYSFITTQDDLIGNAVEDVVVGQFYPGANWVIKGENNVTKGWLKLEMR
jgi:hypothetical protein